MFGKFKIVAFTCCIVTLTMPILMARKATAQCTVKTRTYATIQQYNATGTTSINNASYAADGDPSTFSKLNRPLPVGTVTQFISFGTSITAGTPVTVKLGLSPGLVALAGGIEIQPFTGLTNSGGWQATAVGVSTSSTNLLSLLNGAGDMAITITPQKADGTTISYEGVWIRLTGIAVGQSLNVYDAYIDQTNTATPLNCGKPVDVLAGVRQGALGNLSLNLGTVTNPFNAIDNDASFSTYAELNVGASVGGQVFHTTIFNTISQPGDVVRMVLQDGNGGLLDLSVISNFTIQLYNGTTPVGSALGSSSGLLSLTLLPGGSNKYQLDIKPQVSSGAFDRIEVQIGGIAAVSTSVRIYNVKRIPATPALTIDGADVASKTICQGGTASLAVTNLQSCTSYNWYDAAAGGNLLATGTAYTPTAASLTAGTHQYYIEATRTNCTETSDRSIASIVVNPLPVITPGTIQPVCQSASMADIPYTTDNPTNTYNILWDAAALAAGFVPVSNAALLDGTIHVATPSTAPAGTYNGTITVKNSNGCVSAGKPIAISIIARPTPPIVNLTQ